MAPSGNKSRVDGILFSRWGAAIGSAVFVLILLGCMNFAIGNRVTEDQNGVLEQKGNVHLQPHAEEDVYYPVPYANVPNMELTDAFSRNGFQIVDQKEDHFRVRNS